MKAIWNRLKPKTKQNEYATLEDVYNCYRILLNREPDEAGLAYWTDLVQTQNITMDMMADGFLRSFEFKQRQAERNKPHLVQLPDYKIFVRTNDLFVGAPIATTKAYEPLVTEAVKKHLKAGDIFVDIGANIGYFSLLAASIVGTDGHVYAFEPIAENGDFLEQSVAENGFQNVTLFRNAVAERKQMITFTGGGADSNGRIINEHETKLTAYPLPTIEAVTLDETLIDLPKLSLIKMDIEGAEPRAFAGMQQIIQKFKPTILTEFSPNFIKTTSNTDPLQFLEALSTDYELFILDDKPKASKSVAQIMEIFAHTPNTHLDLMAKPK